ncbi:MAG: PorT family protein [Thermoflexibacter sp.]|jgi:hypothetical protein|nr:PorT family protein [Thermoflexibacter sp.]
MNKFLVSLFSLMLFLVISSASLANHAQNLGEQDSMVIQFGRSKVVIYLANKDDKAKLQEMYDKGILKDVFKYLDAPQFADTAMVKDNNGEYRIIKKGGLSIIYFDKIKDIDRNTRVDMDWSKNLNNDRDRDDDNDDDDDDNDRVKRNRYRMHNSHEFGLDLGLNSFIPKEGSLSGTLYELNPTRSNYVALNYFNVFNLSRYARFKVGVEVSWYNFMFDKDIRLSTQTNALDLSLDPNGLRKSKLGVTYLNLPVLFEVGRRYWGMRFGVGGYVGYRVKSWTKAVTLNGDKQKDNDSYHLNNFRYGVTGQIGFRWIKLFVNYDLNPLFIKDKAPEVNTLSIGFRFGDGY